MTIMMIVGALSSVGSSVLGFTSQAKLAKKQQAAQDKYMAEYTKATWADYAQQANTTLLNEQQQIDAQAMQNQQAAVSNLQSKSTAEASALENGVSGNSIDSLLRGYDRAIAVNDYISGQNVQMLGYQTEQDIKALRANAVNSINSAKSGLPMIQKPSVGAALLNGLNNAATSTAQGYEIGKTFKRTGTPTTKNTTGGTRI